MDEASRDESTQEPLDDEERELLDPELWDWDNLMEVVLENPLAVLPIKLTNEEHHLIAQRARVEGLSAHAFVKRAALASAGADQTAPQTLSTPRAATG